MPLAEEPIAEPSRRVVAKETAELHSVAEPQSAGSDRFLRGGGSLYGGSRGTNGSTASGTKRSARTFISRELFGAPVKWATSSTKRTETRPCGSMSVPTTLPMAPFNSGRRWMPLTDTSSPSMGIL
eukprot:CAMPEP_0117522934 /NCGR_PEP_ID=MMETSP0784-20121206/34464_1 /TAXON_ID=39447 /ORGANISM="" /LENGTH=125 /DNA_ID=CAMNT_0005319023 /DNA_START=74 /DNA_END=451 /DNA_ORIENTATION=+